METAIAWRRRQPCSTGIRFRQTSQPPQTDAKLNVFNSGIAYATRSRTNRKRNAPVTSDANETRPKRPRRASDKSNLVAEIDETTLQQQIRQLMGQLSEAEREQDLSESMEWTVPAVTTDELVKLSEEQRTAYYRVLNGDNVFFTGGAGVGKTHIMTLMVQQARHLEPGTVAVVAATGMASGRISGGQTIHSFLGLPPGFYKEEFLSKPLSEQIASAYRFIETKPTLLERFRIIKHLYVDEISMLYIRLFELTDAIMRRCRNSKLPFGGLQVVSTGDFFQLPPFRGRSLPPANRTQSVRQTGKSDRHRHTATIVADQSAPLFAFQSPIWYDVFPIANCIVLSVCYRQRDDKLFIDMLNEIRVGRPSTQTVERLQKRLVDDDGYDDDPDDEGMMLSPPPAEIPNDCTAGGGDSKDVQSSNTTATVYHSTTVDATVPFVCTRSHNMFVPHVYCTNKKVRRCNKYHMDLLWTSCTLSDCPQDAIVHSSEIVPLYWSDAYIRIYELRKKQYDSYKRRNPSQRTQLQSYIMRRFLSKYKHMEETHVEWKTDDDDEESDQSDSHTPSGEQLPAQKLRLVPGMPVMLMKNIDVARGLVNGRRGFVLCIDSETRYPWVGWLTDRPQPPTLVEPHIWWFSYNLGKQGYKQLPLKPGWAFTVHKLQGTSLDRGTADLSDVFVAGQMYCALSRFTHLNRIKLLGLDINKIVADARVTRFMQRLMDAQPDASHQQLHHIVGIETKSTKPTLSVKERLAQIAKEKQNREQNVVVAGGTNIEALQNRPLSPPPTIERVRLPPISSVFASHDWSCNE